MVAAGAKPGRSWPLISQGDRNCPRSRSLCDRSSDRQEGLGDCAFLSDIRATTLIKSDQRFTFLSPWTKCGGARQRPRGSEDRRWRALRGRCERVRGRRSIDARIRHRHDLIRQDPWTTSAWSSPQPSVWAPLPISRALLRVLSAIRSSWSIGADRSAACKEPVRAIGNLGLLAQPARSDRRRPASRRRGHRRLL